MSNGKTKFNFAATFSLAVLLIYSYISFLGLVYWRKGEIMLPLALTLGFIFTVLVGIFIMSISKSTRWKNIGTFGQCFFGFIVLIAFILSSLPFTNFMGVIEKRDGIKEEISKSFTAAEELRDAYTSYAKARIENYKSKLYEASVSKQIRPIEYQGLMAGAAGQNDKQKIENLARSLQAKLMPDSMDIVMKRRLDWLEKSSQMSILNMKLPANIEKINNEVADWTQNFKDLSTVVYNGEDAQEFEYQAYDSQIQKATSFYTELHKPSFFALICSFVGFAIMLLPFFMAQKNNAGKVSDNRQYE